MSSQEHVLQPLGDALLSPMGLLQRRLRAWIPDPAPWVRRREEGSATGVSTFRPLDPCSPAGPSGPRGPWNRKKGLAQWTAGVSLGLGTRGAGLPRALSFALHKLYLPASHTLPTLRWVSHSNVPANTALRRAWRGWMQSEAPPFWSEPGGGIFTSCLKNPWWGRRVEGSQPTHFIDSETEGRAKRHVATSRQPGLQTPSPALPRAHVGLKQLVDHSPWGNLTEDTLGRVCTWSDVWSCPLSSLMSSYSGPAHMRRGRHRAAVAGALGSSLTPETGCLAL